MDIVDTPCSGTAVIHHDGSLTCSDCGSPVGVLGSTATLDTHPVVVPCDSVILVGPCDYCARLSSTRPAKPVEYATR